MRVALVHDWLNQNGGAERVLEVLHDLYPDAPVFTSLYAPDRVPGRYREWDIRTSFMQRLPLAKSHHQAFLPLYPLAFQSFDFGGYDLVISNSSGFCHGIRPGRGTVHVNYCLTPPRFLWMPEAYLVRERVRAPARWVLPPFIAGLRRVDRGTVQQVDRFVAISRAVQERIRRWYGRDSDIVYPPVDTGAFRPVAEPDDYYLVASRLIPYKRVDLAVRAFNELKLPLRIVGEGRDRAALEAIAGPNVRFEGWVSYGRLQELVARCRAFVFPGEEDFGIAPVEAQAAGRPVVALAAGGALDTVVDGVTGVLFPEATPQSLAEAVVRLESLSLVSEAIRQHALAFDTSVFRERLRAVVRMAMEEAPVA